jgi:hypothetical protein
VNDALPYQPRVDHCERTGKLSYGSRAAATHSRGNRRNKGRKMRAYECPVCHFWHLSSEAFSR